MKEQLEKLFRELNGIKEFIATADEAVKKESQEKIVQLEGKLTELLAHNDAMKQEFAPALEKFSDLEKRVTWFEQVFGKSAKSIGLPGLEEEKSKFSILKAMAAIHTGDWSDAGFEKAVMEETRKKAMETQDNSSGGFLVPTEVSQDIIELLRPESIGIGLGITVLSGLTGGNWEVPAGRGGIVTYWVREGVALTPSDESWGQVTLKPKEIGALVTMSLQFAKRARPDAENYIRMRLAQELALGIDKAIFMGTGGENQPLGLWNTPGIETLTLGGGNGADFTLEDIVDAEGKLEDNDALMGKLALAMHPKIKRKLKKTRIAQYSGDTGGEYLFKGFTDAALAEFLGYPFKTTTQLPTNLVVGGSGDISPMFFANWQDILLGQWGNFEIAVATQAGQAFEKRQMLMRITQEVDVAIARKQSVCAILDARTNNA